MSLNVSNISYNPNNALTILPKKSENDNVLPKEFESLVEKQKEQNKDSISLNKDNNKEDKKFSYGAIALCMGVVGLCIWGLASMGRKAKPSSVNFPNIASSNSYSSTEMLTDCVCATDLFTHHDGAGLLTDLAHGIAHIF